MPRELPGFVCSLACIESIESITKTGSNSIESMTIFGITCIGCITRLDGEKLQNRI
jgi:hypothetical protein